MTYLAIYERKGRNCVQVLKRGFACTRAELPSEIAKAVKADKLLDWRWYDNAATARAIARMYHDSHGLWKWEGSRQ